MGVEQKANIPVGSAQPGILVDREILEMMGLGMLKIDPFDLDSLEPATYDLRVGSTAVVSTLSEPVDLRERPLLTIEPYASAFLQTDEILELAPRMVGRLGPRSNLSRHGIFVSTGPQIDPGFQGRLFVNLLNVTDRPFLIRYRARFLTVEFHLLAAAPDHIYAGPNQCKTELSEDDINRILGRGGPSLKDVHRDLLEMHQLLNTDRQYKKAQSAPEEIRYDAFISHAGEDKEKTVKPLATALSKMGYRVWYDEFELRVGDSLRESIDRGLINSRFGIVVLSPAFFAKNWPQYELNGLTAREMDGHKVILPIWHMVEREDVLAYSPTLANKVALSTKRMKLRKIAEELGTVFDSDRIVELNRVAQTPSIMVPISTLAPEPYTLVRDIPCLIQPTDGGFVATFFDANISASGDTQQEALENLKTLLVDIFDDLVSEPNDKLGPEPKRQLEVLNTLIRKQP